MPLQYDVLRALLEMFKGDRQLLKDWLLQYYQTQVGKQALASSPHAARPLEQFVDELLTSPQLS